MSESGASFHVNICALSVSEAAPHFARLMTWLSHDELERAQRFHQEADRKRNVIGRALIRRVCATHLQCDPRDVILGESPNGKPRLEFPAELLEFNVSHSGDCVIILWGKNVCGVDVEAMDRTMTSSFDDMAETAFSADERVVLKGASPDEKAKTFYRIWTRKEAVLKAEGCGLGTNTKAFSVALHDAGQTHWLDEVPFPASGLVWKITDIAALPNHIAAAATAPGSIITQCTPDEIGLW